MEQSIKWYQSKTVISGAIIVALAVFQLAGFDFDKGFITELVTNLFGLIAGVMTIYGRMFAKHKIN